MLITPEYVFKDVTHITPEFLAGKGIRALVLDIDNTLTADRSQELPDEVAGWLAQMKEAGIGLTIVSNGAEKRVRPFAKKLGLAYLYRSAKPLPFALMVARRRMGVKRKQMAMVGDQLYACLLYTSIANRGEEWYTKEYKTLNRSFSANSRLPKTLGRNKME